jgi:hypothetical protein
VHRDRIVGRARLVTPAAVAHHQLDVLDTQFGQRRASVLDQLGDPLHADDSTGELGQHGAGVARSGPDFEHALGSLQLERLADRGHHPGLGDRLAVPDREGRVGIGPGTHVLGDEQLPRHLAHRPEHALVLDASPAQLALDHPRPLGFEVGRPPQNM